MMKTMNLIMGKGTAVKDAAGSEGKVKLPVADRKFAPKAKTPSFGEALEEARGGKGQMNQPKVAAQKPSAPLSDGSKTALSKADLDAEKTTEKVARTDEADGAPTSKARETAAKADQRGETADKSAVIDETLSEEPEVTTATTLNAMLLAMAANSLEPLSTADASAAEPKSAAPNAASNLPVEPRPMALETLLPQDAAKTMQAVQNQQLMEMLSGSLVNTAADAAVASVWGAEAGLRPEALAAEAALAQAEPLAAMSENLSASSASTGEANGSLAEQALVAVSTTAVPLQKEAADPAVKNTAGSLWQGIGLTVEDTIALPEEAALRADVGDMAGGNAQRDAQTPASLTDVFGTVTRQGAQLPEEAAFDTVKITEGNQPDSVPQPVTSAFTPAVGLTNAAGTAGAAAAPPTDGYEVVRQIVDQAKLIRTDGSASEMVIRLKPEHLGELTMRISVAANGAVNASFHTDNPQTRGLIESSMIQLKQELSAQGIKVDNVSVYSGLSEDFFANSQAGQQGYPQPQHSARSERADREAFAGDAEAASAVGVGSGSVSSLDPNVGTADGVDYRV